MMEVRVRVRVKWHTAMRQKTTKMVWKYKKGDKKPVKSY